MSNSFAFLENASNNDPLEIASKQKEVKQEQKPKVEEKKVTQQPRKQKPVASSEAVEEGFQATRTNARGGRQQHKGYQPPKKGRSFDHHVSGTGRVKGEQKKGGSGKGNWGKSTEVAPKEEKPVVEQASEAAGEQQPQQPTEEKKEETVAAPVDNSLTLEEYFAAKKSSKVQIKKESGAELVTGKNVKLVDAAFERPSDDLFQKEKKKVEQGEKKAEKKSEKPKTISASDFLDTAALEKIKQKRDRELENGPKREREPRTTSARPAGNKGPRNNNAKGGQKTQKPSTAGAKKPRAPVLNKEKDFPALNPQN